MPFVTTIAAQSVLGLGRKERYTKSIPFTFLSTSSLGTIDLSWRKVIPGLTVGYFLMGGGGSGSASHYQGGGAGNFQYGTFTTSGGLDTITITAAGRSQILQNPTNINLEGVPGESSSIVAPESSINITATGGKRGYTSAAEAAGSSGGGGAGNGGFGGVGGSGGSNGSNGNTYVGGTGIGTTNWNTATSWLTTKIQTYSLNASASISAGAGGNPTTNSNCGGGGGGGLVFADVAEISTTPSGLVAPRTDVATQGTSAVGWGAGGTSGGYNSTYGRGTATGQGAQGFAMIWTE